MTRINPWIRKGKLADLNSIYRIEIASFKDPYSAPLLLNLMALYPDGFFVAEKDGVIIGYMIIRSVGLKGHIIALAVGKGYRNKKVGSKLLEKGLEILRHKGVNGVWLEVRVSNITAQRFYIHKGFKMINLIKGYYSDGEDAQILYLPFSS